MKKLLINAKKALFLTILIVVGNSVSAQLTTTKCYSGPTVSMGNTFATNVGNINFNTSDIPATHSIVEVIVEIVWSKTDDGSCGAISNVPVDLSHVGFKIQGPGTPSRFLAASTVTANFASPVTSSSFSGIANIVKDTIVFRDNSPSLLPATLPSFPMRDTVAPNNDALLLFQLSNPLGNWTIAGIDDLPDSGPQLCIHSYCITLITCVPDTDAPVPVLAVLPDLNATCVVNSLTPPTATDNCGVITAHNITLPYYNPGTSVVTWTYQDLWGNTSTQTQNIIISELTGTNNTTICNNESITINGTVYDASNSTGTEVFTNIGPNNCDSTVTVNLNVLPELTGSNNTTICHNESITINGTVYDASNSTGTEVFTNIGPNNCDSTVTVNLNVLPELTGSNNTTICNNESVTINGTVYDASNSTGTEVFTNIGSNNCDSTVTVSLNVTTTNITTTQNGAELSANTSGATYQWVDCDNGNASITGETNQTFTAVENGNYAVEVTENGCTETSTCMTVEGLGIKANENGASELVEIYPNPTTNNVFVKINDANLTNYTVNIYNVVGELVLTQQINTTTTQINTSQLENGVYFVEINNSDAKQVLRLVKS